MSQYIACTIRSRVLAQSERLAFAVVRARTTPAAGSELVRHIHAVACLPGQGPEALPLTGSWYLRCLRCVKSPRVLRVAELGLFLLISVHAVQ